MGEIRLQIDKKLHKQLKLKALDDGITLKDLSIKALEKYVQEKIKTERGKSVLNE